MSRGSTSADRAVFVELSRTGLLLQSDPLLPNVASIVSGERIVGSWWGHKKGHEIFALLKRLDANPDAMTTRLVSGKVTYLHRRLWSDLLTLATSRDEWQTRGLSRAAHRILRLVLKKGELRMDLLNAKGSTPSLAKGAREIERRLLVYSDEVHTETGAHAKVLMVWSRCPKLIGFRSSRKNPIDSMSRFDDIIRKLNKEYGARATLPWHSVEPRGRNLGSLDFLSASHRACKAGPLPAGNED